MPEETPQPEAFHLAGDRLGKFVILSELGRGSMGVVYEALQEDLKRKVALKILPANITLDVKQVRRFHREAESVARLRHDNIIQIYEVGEIDRTHYFAMEMVNGQPLGESFGRDRESILRAARIAMQAARGLAHAHERGVVHRDVKPGNLLIDRDGRVVVTDFGLARLTDSASLTSTDAIVGTPKYMSPEQILPRTDQPVDGRTDVYSLGATLYHVITGRPPFEAPTVQAFIKAILEERAPSPRRHNKQVPHDLATIIRRCLEKDPRDRYASAAELADDLERFLSGERIRARPKGTAALALETARRHKIVVALSFLAAVGLVVGLVFGGQAAEQASRARFEAQLRSIAEGEDLYLAIEAVEELKVRLPGDADVEEVRRRLYQKRAEQTLRNLDPDRSLVLADLERAGEAHSFWHLMLLVDENRYDEAQAAALALPEESLLRRLVLARLAVEEGRYGEVEALLPAVPEDADPAATVFFGLARAQAHRALGDVAKAREHILNAVRASALLPQAWLRARVVWRKYETLGGTDLADVLATVGGAVGESMRSLTRFWGKMTQDEQRSAQRYFDRVLKLAGVQALPGPALETVAQEALRTATGRERGPLELLLAVARLTQGRADAARDALEEAGNDADRALEPYVFWGWSLVTRAQNELLLSLVYGQQAIDSALALEGFADLEPLLRHTVLVYEGARMESEESAARAAEFLRQKLSGRDEPWAEELSARLPPRAPPGNGADPPR